MKPLLLYITVAASLMSMSINTLSYDDLSCNIPYAEYEGNSYSASLNYVGDTSFIWTLDLASVQKISEFEIFSEVNNGQAITLPNGSRFRVVLDSNPTTGYLWRIDDFNFKILQLKNSTYRTSCDPKEIITGCGGKEAWLFEVIGTGITRLEMTYRPAWEAEGSTSTPFYLDISVHEVVP